MARLINRLNFDTSACAFKCWNGMVERQLTQSGLTRTILRPTGFEILTGRSPHLRSICLSRRMPWLRYIPEKAPGVISLLSAAADVWQDA